MREHHAQDDLPFFEGDEFAPGDGIFVGPDRIGRIVRRPSDYAAQATAGTPYVMTLNIDGRWIWAILDGAAIVEGLGTRLGTSLGHD